MKKIALMLLTVSWCIGRAALADVSFSHAAPDPATPPGLLVNVYHLGHNQNQLSPPTYQSVFNMLRWVQTRSPNYGFVDTAVNATQSISLSGNDTSRTSVLLGSHATASARSDTNAVGTTIFDWRGWVYFPAEGTYTLNLSNADDAAAVYIGGNMTPGSGNLFLINDYSGSLGPHGTGVPDPVHSDIYPINGASQTGWYPIEILYYNQTGGGSGNTSIDFSITGPAAVQFKTPRVFTPNPYHWYTFATDGSDSDPAAADRFTADITGGATIVNGALVTDGASPVQGARLSAAAVAPFFGSFTIEQWFTRTAVNTGFDVLFSISTDADHSVMAHPQRPDNNRLSVDIHPGDGNQYSLTSSSVHAETPTHMALVYDAPTTTAKLYINSRLQSTVLIPPGLSLASMADDAHTGINGFSPRGDPSFVGTTDEFRIYRFALSQAQITQEFIEHLGE